MDEVVTEFLVESNEALDQIDLDFITLESNPSSHETLASVFRAVHTIKGTCGFLGFEKLERLTHVGETLLGRLRDGGLEMSGEITNALLALSDAIREMLGLIEATGKDGDNDYPELARELARLHAGDAPDAAAAPAGAAEEPDGEPAEGAAPSEPAATPREAAPPAPESEEQPAPLAKTSSSTPRASKPVQRAADSASPAAETRSGSVADRSVRVDVGLLDSLMNQVGELVLARNQILQHSSAHEDPAFVTTTQRLNLITTELQEEVMKTRMQPIGSVWNKLPRVVRDLSRSLGKQVRLDMEGEETELDRTIIEAIKDPLTHVVRNAIDHGIEEPADRVASGKAEEGRVLLRAYHEGGHVNIEVIDDGRGIDLERVREKSVRSGLMTPEQAGRLSEREALNLIFHPGLSTAAKVTNISGRGVGMDVVKTNVEKIGGTVDIQSRLGNGSALRIKIPLTLAIIPALIVASGGDHYAIPQVCLLELVRLEGDQAVRAVETIHDVPVYRLRGNLLPIVWLNEQLQVGSRDDLTGDGEGGPCLNIAVLQADERQFGLVVDEIQDNQEIVVKPLDKCLKNLESYAGATIMGDGRVALILDALGLAHLSGVVSHSGAVPTAPPAKAASDDEAGDGQMLLLFSTGPSERMAIPLSAVARLEEFESARVERAGGRKLVQYRGEILPLISLNDVFGVAGEPSGEDEPLQVIVHSEGDVSVGIVVDAILDIVEERISIQSRIHREGVLGTAVVQGHVTEIVDTSRVLELVGLEPAHA